MISLEECVKLIGVFSDMKGGEIYVEIPSMKVTDIAEVISPKSNTKSLEFFRGKITRTNDKCRRFILNF